MCPCRLPKTNPARVRVIMDPVKGVRTPAKVSVYWIKGAAARHRGEREAVPTVEDTREREASQPLEAVVRFDGGDQGLNAIARLPSGWIVRCRRLVAWGR